MQPHEDQEIVIGGYRLPTAILDAMQTEIWQTTPAALVSQVMPFLYAPIEFLTLNRMRTYNGNRERRDTPIEQRSDEEQQTIDFELEESRPFRVYFGSESVTQPDLPWLDKEQTFMLADNLHHGDDLQCVFLDFRSSQSSPRVVAPRLSSTEFHYDWITVSDSFEQFWAMFLDSRPSKAT